MIWSSEDIAKATNGKINNNWVANKISIDTRRIDDGDLFIALKGLNTDGHNYLAQAIEAGARAVIIDHFPDNISKDFNYCLVQDTREALYDLAKYNRRRLKAKIIAVTGSAGKTSTKEIIKIALSPYGKVFANYGNYNNDLGVAISLANTEEDTEYAIYEIGMNRAGEIKQLVNMIKPDIGIITNVAPAHLEFFDSVKDIARAKAEILLGIKKDGYIILNADNEYYNFLVDESHSLNIKHIVSFAKDNQADAKLVSYTENSNENSTVELNLIGKKLSYNLNFAAIHLAMNSVIALIIVKILKLDTSIAAHNLVQFSPVKERGEMYKLEFNNKNITLLNDSYNANPCSMKASLVSLGNKTGKRKLAIISDMKELGEGSKKFHEDLLPDIVNNEIDKVITVGDNMHYLYMILPKEKKLNHYSNTDQIIDDIKQHIQDDDVVLIKGSLGAKIYELAKYIIDQSKVKI